MEEVKLLGTWFSPFSCRVEMALKLKGVSYELIDEDLSNKSDLLLKYNPVYKKIPVLVHNGKVILDSVLILEYIEETWKTTHPLLPSHPYQKANARFWVNFLNDKCMNTLWKCIWAIGEEEEKKAKEEAVEVLRHLENELLKEEEEDKKKKFFGGESIGMVDIVANFVAYWFRVIQEALNMEHQVFNEKELPRLWKWAEEYVNSDLVKECLPPKDLFIANFPPPYMGNDLVAFFKSRLHHPSSAPALALAPAT